MPVESSPEQQLEALIFQLPDAMQTLLRASRKAIQKRYTTANELVYDYGKALVISYSPNERGVDAVVALSAEEKGLRLAFNHGSTLPDPRKLLLGKADIMRYILLESVEDLNRPEVEALMIAAESKLLFPIAPSGKGQLIIKESKRKKAADKK
jgi:hypothetical protein